MLNQLEHMVHQFRCPDIFDSLILDRTLSFQYVKVNYLINHLKMVSLIYYMVSEINILTKFR